MKNWTVDEIVEVYNNPLLELVFKAAEVHRKYFNPREVQISSLLSIKTGGCVENCGYCSQSSKNDATVEAHRLLSVAEVERAATLAKESGASRLCMGAAWRSVKDNKDFDNVLEMVKAVNDKGLETCCTLGMLTEEQAKKLENAGLYAYNHNVDTSEEYYDKVVTTRNYKDRLDTIQNIRNTKITVCSGGIIGMGESIRDRAAMLLTLSRISPQPESVPINALVPVEGTPMEKQKIVSSWEMIRMVATAKIVMPKSVIRLSAGRTELSVEAQGLCFLAGASSIFAGDKLLTTPNPKFDKDKEMFWILGLIPAPSDKITAVKDRPAIKSVESI